MFFYNHNKTNIYYLDGAMMSNTDILPFNIMSKRFSPLVESVYQEIIYLFLNQNVCCGCSKEPSQ